MTTFNGKKELKAACLERANIEQGRLNAGEDRKLLFWSRRQWCDPDIKCEIPDCKHEFYSVEVGIPVAIAYAERAFYLTLPLYAAANWPSRFLEYTPLDVEVDDVWRKFVTNVLSDNEHGMLNFARNRLQNDAIVLSLEDWEQDVSLEDSWVSAIEACDHVCQTGGTLTPSSKEEAFEASGYWAARTAGDIARSHSQPRFAASVIRHMAEPVRLKAIGTFLASQQDPRQKLTRDTSWTVKDKINQEWDQLLAQACTVGDSERDRELIRLSDLFLAMLWEKAPPGPVKRFFSKLFG